MNIEIVVYNIESAIKAQEGGANRIELCDNPAQGGTTPSAGTLETVRRNISIDIFVMIRPRGGDFYYSNQEFEAMKYDIEQCKKLMINGVVLGILTADGRMDKKRCKELIDLARPMKVTCHRAFDMTREPFEALEDCIEAGFDRILTSGRQLQALQGALLIHELIKKSNGRISIMPGSGVNESTVNEIIMISGANEIHFSATAFRESEMKYKNEQIATMGSSEEGEFTKRTVDPERVKKIKSIAEQAVL